jgi:hypothetical protein
MTTMKRWNVKGCAACPLSHRITLGTSGGATAGAAEMQDVQQRCQTWSGAVLPREWCCRSMADDVDWIGGRRYARSSGGKAREKAWSATSHTATRTIAQRQRRGTNLVGTVTSRVAP